MTLKTSGPVLATAGTVLLCKSIIPATLVILLGTVVGIDGVLGVSILALLVAVDNSNGGLWLAFTGRYGDKRDRGAYISSALNDGPFFSMLFLGSPGWPTSPSRHGRGRHPVPDGHARRQHQPAVARDPASHALRS